MSVISPLYSVKKGCQTFLIVLGIAIGVSVQIFIVSLIQGLQKSLIEKTIGNSSQITLVSKGDDKEIKDYENLREKIAKVDENIKTITVVNDQAAFMEYGDNSQSILMRGFQIDEADEIYGFMDNMAEGTYPKKGNEIILPHWKLHRIFLRQGIRSPGLKCK